MAHQNSTRATRRDRQGYWLHNPGLFAKQILGVNPWSKQQDILEALSKHRFVAVRSCNGSGKTFTAAIATIWWLMAHDEAIVITTAPTQRQVRQLLWREIRNIHMRNRDIIGGKFSSTSLEISNRRFAFGFATNSVERFQGFHHENILIIVDEASGVHENIFDAILGSISSANAKILMIGNPTFLAGTFYDAFHKNRDNWKTIHISAFDTPGFQNIPPTSRSERDASEPSPKGRHESQGVPETLSSSALPQGLANPEWAEHIAKERGRHSSAYQVRILGEFPSEHDDTLIPLRHIEAAVGRDVEIRDEHETVMGIDIARFGDSKTVAVIRKGPRVLRLYEFRRTDLMQTTGRALDLARRHHVKTVYIDEVGLGAGVLDRFNEINDIQAVGVNVGKKADDTERYANLRAQMLDGLRERFADNDISIPDDAELISQLASMTYRYTSRGQLQLEQKDQIRSSGRQSPDKADALALAFTTPFPEKNPLMIWI